MKLRYQFALIAGLLGAPGCQCQRSESTAQAFPAHDKPVLYATDQVELADISDFFKRVFGAEEYITQWSQLEGQREGSVDDERIPYMDSWYPEGSGGTNLDGALSRYDQAFFSGTATAAKWEAQYHSRRDASWYGHCNGTSVAASRFQNPLASVRRPRGCVMGSANCVEFQDKDIRALLSEINMNARAKFISGRRCNLERKDLDSRPTLRTNPKEMDACDDVNPGSFHIALANFIGRMKQPIIFDESQDAEVWNYPIYRYKFDISGRMNEQEAIRALQIPDQIDHWVFNDQARSWVKVNATVWLRHITSEIPGNAGSQPEGQTKSYEYVLELDDNGDVIGGEWVGSHRYNHPDFLWMPFEPMTPTGDQSRGNPYLSNTEVISIWAESMGFDTSNPFRDKPKNSFDVRFYPPSDLTWGVVQGYYRMLLDGRSTGSLFLGKKSHLRLEVADVLKDAKVQVFLNGQALPDIATDKGFADITFDSPAGLNIISLKWASARVSDEELDWEFRYFAM